MSPIKEINISPWRKPDILLFMGAVMQYGENDWRQISSFVFFGSKSPKKCKAEWFKSIKPTITKDEWNKLASILSDSKFFEKWKARTFESLMPISSKMIEIKLSKTIEPRLPETIKPISSEIIEPISETVEPSPKKAKLNEEDKNDKELLRLAKLKPELDWATIASIIGGTAVECLERYVYLLHQTQEKEEGKDGTDDPRKLKSDEIDPNRETELALPSTSCL